jgi:hypothetical protein
MYLFILLKNYIFVICYQHSLSLKQFLPFRLVQRALYGVGLVVLKGRFSFHIMTKKTFFVLILLLRSQGMHNFIYFGDLKALLNEAGLHVYVEQDSVLAERLRDLGARWNDKRSSMFISTEKALRIDAAMDFLEEHKKEYFKKNKINNDLLKSVPILEVEDVEVIDRRQTANGFIVIQNKYNKPLYNRLSKITGAEYNQTTRTWHIPTFSIAEYNKIKELSEANVDDYNDVIFSKEREDGFKAIITEKRNIVLLQIYSFKEEDLFDIKKIPNAKFNGKDKTWSVPIANKPDMLTSVEKLFTKELNNEQDI